MSWGYFLDLNLTLPTSEWTRLSQTKTGAHAIAPTWWGFKEDGLGMMFTAADFDDMTLGDAVSRFACDESVCKMSEDGDQTTVRLVQLLDKGGDPSIAKSIAALVDAAQGSGQGTLRLVNDGSYSGEDGVEITASGGALSRKALSDSWKYASKLGAEVYGGLLEGDEAFEDEDDEDGNDGEDGEDAAPAAPAPKQAAAKKPATKKPAAKNAAAKKPATKKAAAKKGAAKKPAKAAAKKAAAKKPAKAAAKKAAAKKPAKAAARKPAKNAPAKKPAKSRRK